MLNKKSLFLALYFTLSLSYNEKTVIYWIEKEHLLNKNQITDVLQFLYKKIVNKLDYVELNLNELFSKYSRLDNSYYSLNNRLSEIYCFMNDMKEKFGYEFFKSRQKELESEQQLIREKLEGLKYKNNELLKTCSDLENTLINRKKELDKVQGELLSLMEKTKNNPNYISNMLNNFDVKIRIVEEKYEKEINVLNLKQNLMSGIFFTIFTFFGVYYFVKIK